MVQPLHFLRSIIQQSKFHMQLAQLNHVLEPIVRAIKCLEGLDVTLSNVFEFYIVIPAVLNRLFAENLEGYPEEVVGEIHCIINACIEEQLGDEVGAIYITHYFLTAGVCSGFDSHTLLTGCETISTVRCCVESTPIRLTRTSTWQTSLSPALIHCPIRTFGIHYRSTH